MFATSVLSLIPIILSTLLASFISGGSIAEIIDLPDFLGVILIFSVCMFISGYGTIFCRIFSSRKKYNALNLQELQKTETALKMAEKILLYSALLFPTMSLIVLLAETPYKGLDYSSIGPNSAICFLSVVYLCLFEIIIHTLAAKNRKAVILYMAEPDEATEEVNNSDKPSTVHAANTVKAILAVVLLAAISWLYVFSYFGFGLSRFFVVGAICDIPSLLCIVMYVLPLIAISGCSGDLLAAGKTVFSGRKLNITKKNLYLNAVKTAIALNWYAAVTSTVIGWIGMMNNLEDASGLFPNISVSLIPLFYAILLNLLLMIVETRINTVSE